MRWAFFVDANLEPSVADGLEREGYRADYSDYVLTPDADDEDDILPYVRQEELIVVTADVKNFAAFEQSRHEGVFYLDNQRTPPHEIVDAVLEIIDQYGSPAHMNGKTENLDNWLPDRS